MIGLLSLGFFAAAGVLFSLSLKPKGGLEFAISSLVSAASLVILAGYCLSELNAIGNIQMWLACSSVALSVCVVQAAIAKVHRTLPAMGRRFLQLKSALPRKFKNQPLHSRLVLALLIVFLVVQVVQLVVALSFAPAHHDSNSYILPRMAHYVQQGNLDFYDSSYTSRRVRPESAAIAFTARTVHAKNETVLQIYAFLASGRKENAVNLVAWMCGLLATLAVFGISRAVWKATLPALMAACIFGLLTNNLMLAVTAQSDMPITGFLAAAVYFMLLFFQDRRRRLLAFSAVATAIAVGIKSSALLLIPSLGLIFIVGLARAWRHEGKSAALGSASAYAAVSVLALLTFAVPAGYWDNWSRYGNLMGPEDWRREHVLEKVGVRERIEVGTANAARYLVHFVSLEGLPARPFFRDLQTHLRKPLIRAFQMLGLELHSTKYVRQPFVSDRYFEPHEDYAYSGPSALLFILPAVIVTLWRHRSNSIALALIAGGLLYFMAQSYSSLYDPWRGRSFANLGVFMAPLVACLFLPRAETVKSRRSYIANGLLVLNVAVVLFAGLNSALFRSTTPLDAMSNRGDRLQQICRTNSPYLKRLRRFESLVPENATVLVSVANAAYNYPLYGQSLRRKIIFEGEPHSRGEIDFHLFASNAVEPRPGDVLLDEDVPPGRGGRWFLRRLVGGRAVAAPTETAWQPVVLDDFSLETLHEFGAEGFGRLEGPFPEHDAPRPIRWMLRDTAELRFACEKSDCRQRVLRLQTRSLSSNQLLRIFLNGSPVGEVKPGSRWTQWESGTLTLSAGQNTLTFRASGFVKPPQDGRRLYVLFDELSLPPAHSIYGEENVEMIQAAKRHHRDDANRMPSR